jgi:VIT1/CCC1 family predicted Fe2+/Mn2+ transporter
MEKKLLIKILDAQRNEITEHFIYKKLAASVKEKNNRDILNKIAEDELKHYQIWKKFTKKDVKPSAWNIKKHYFISKIFGLTFGLKFMERGERGAQINYEKISKQFPDAKKIMHDEEAHEKKLINMLDEERLQYVGSIVLGLNDALVELTGALAGLTFALQNAKIVATAGLVTGIAAAFSMAASEYLSKKSEEGAKNPLKSSIYTGIAYMGAVLFLIFPYLVMNNLVFSLIWTLLNAIIIIFSFTYYISIAKDFSFKKRFFEMAAISMGVAFLSFGVGAIIRLVFGIDV